jgi:hypothetical protein
LKKLLGVKGIQQAYNEAARCEKKVFIFKDREANLYMEVAKNSEEVIEEAKEVIYVISPEKLYTVIDLQNAIFKKLYKNNIEFDHKLNDDLIELLNILAKSNLSV